MRATTPMKWITGTAAVCILLAACGLDADLNVEAGNVSRASDSTEVPVDTTEPEDTTPDSTIPDTVDTVDTTPDSTIPDTVDTTPDSTIADDDEPAITLDPDKPPQDYDEFLQNALNEIQRFWRITFPGVYDEPYQDLQGGVWPVYPGRRDVPGGCGMARTTYRDVEGNAFYCGEGDFIAYDDNELFPQIEKDIGRFALAVALAHEWGHAIQERSGFSAETVLLEMQADCFAGSFVGNLAAGSGKYIQFEEADLVQAINGLFSVRDEPGEVSDNPNAHGSGFDRVGAFQDGYFQGATRCKDYGTDPPQPTLLPFSQEDIETGGNYPYDRDNGDGTRSNLIKDILQPTLDAFWTSSLTAIGISFTVPTIDVGDDDTGARCDDTPEDALRVAFFCPSSNTIVASDERLRKFYDNLGDYAVGMLIGDAYSEAVQRALGSALTGEPRWLADDCLGGAWTKALFPDPTNQDQQQSISAGDLDEGIQTLVAIGDDSGDTNELGSSFEKIDAFRKGVLDGLDACTSMIG